MAFGLGNFSLGAQRRRASGGVTPPFSPTTYLEDHFNNIGGSNVALTGWMPDTTGSVAWSLNAASGGNNAQVAFATDTVVWTSSTANYSVNKTVLPAANYKITATLGDAVATFSKPSILMGFSDTTLDGYQISHDGQAALGMIVQRAVSGAFTTVATLLDSAAWGATPHSVSVSRYVMSDCVQLKITDNTRGYTAIVRDANAARKTTTLYPGLGGRLTATVDDFKVESIDTQNRGGTELAADGIWSWYTDPRAIVSGGKTYIGYINSAGDVIVSKLDGAAVSSFTLKSALEIDDHDNCSLLALASGQVLAFYSRHSATDTFIRYRVSTNALPDISAWNAEAQIATTNVCSYPKPFELGDKIYVFYRDGSGTGRDTRMAVALTADVLAGTPTWTLTTVISVSNQRPYAQIRQNGPLRLDISITNAHPVEGATTLYHGYMQVIAGVPTWFKSDSTSAGAVPINPTTSFTVVQDTTGGTNWNFDFAIGVDGRPRILFTRYPTTPHTNTTTFLTDIEYWHARWTGSAWTNFRLATGQHSLYPSQNAYTAGLCFDGNDPTLIYMASWDTTDLVNKLAKYTINEAGQTVTKSADVSIDPSSHAMRPYSPAGYVAGAAVFWIEGGYNTYTSYQSTVRYAA